MDIVEEKAILEWASKPSKKYASKEVTAEVRKRAQPFLDWLQEAEEDTSDGGNDSGEDIEVSLVNCKYPATVYFKYLTTFKYSQGPGQK